MPSKDLLQDEETAKVVFDDEVIDLIKIGEDLSEV